MNARPAGTQPSRIRWFDIAAVGLIALGVGAFQVSHYAYRSNFADHPDEAAHFVSGVCVLDYFRTALGSNPIRFVESYYAHFPKVALGHWAPMFYLIQAAWFAVLGESAVNSILLAGVTAAVTALILLLRLRRLYGNVIALLCCAVFLSLPLVRAGELTAMSDTAAALFLLLAVLSLCDGCVFQKRKYWLLSGWWAVVAVFTKESALTLMLIIPATLAWRYGRYLLSASRPKAPVAVASAFLFLGLLYAASGLLRIRGTLLLFSTVRAWQVLPQLASILHNGSPVMFLVAAATAIGFYRGKFSRSSDRGVNVAVSAIWLTCTLVCQLFARDSFEPRYLLAAYLPVLILMAEGLSTIQDEIGRRWNKPAIGTAAIVALIVICLISTPTLAMHQRTGYARVAAAIPFAGDDRVVLVSADERGEGGMVAELLLQDPGRSSVVLRATKVLSNSDWIGRDYTLLYRTPDSVMQFLNATPVHWIAIDMTGFINEATRPHHRLLEETIRDYPAEFRLMGDFPLQIDGHPHDHAVQVYENLAARGRRAQAIHLDMTKTLGRNLDIRLTALGNGEAKTAPRAIGFDRPYAAPTELRIAPASDALPARGGVGRIYVTAPPGNPWEVRSVPDWIRIDRGSGTGDGIVFYEVGDNRTNYRRTAAFFVGGLAFSVTQPRSTTTFLPYSEEFAGAVSPSYWLLPGPDPNSTLDPPSQWAVEDLSDRGATAAPTGESSGERRALILQRPGGQTEDWKTQLSLSHIGLMPEQKYKVMFWMKAEQPGVVKMILLPGRGASGDCGLSETLSVSSDWSEFSAMFQVAGACPSGDSRFVLETGKIVGRLWVANFSLAQSQ